jgi:hypothetical protein
VYSQNKLHNCSAAGSEKSPGREIRSYHCLAGKFFFQTPWMSYYAASIPLKGKQTSHSGFYAEKML